MQSVLIENNEGSVGPGAQGNPFRGMILSLGEQQPACHPGAEALAGGRERSRRLMLQAEGNAETSR